MRVCPLPDESLPFHRHGESAGRAGSSCWWLGLGSTTSSARTLPPPGSLLPQIAQPRNRKTPVPRLNIPTRCAAFFIRARNEHVHVQLDRQKKFNTRSHVPVVPCPELPTAQAYLLSNTANRTSPFFNQTGKGMGQPKNLVSHVPASRRLN